MGKEVSKQMPPQVINGIRMCILYMNADLFFPFKCTYRRVCLPLMRDPHLKVESDKHQTHAGVEPRDETSISGKHLHIFCVRFSLSK